MKRIIFIAMVGALFLCQPIFAFVPKGGNTPSEVQTGLGEYNFAPTFTSTGSVIRRVAEGSVDTFTESISDPDGDTFTVTLVGSPTWVTLIKVTDGIYNVSSAPGINTAGVYNFSIRATDVLGGSRNKDVTVVVFGRVAQGIQILSYSPIASTVAINETDSQVFFIEAKSLDGTLTYRWTLNGVDQGIGTPGFGLITTYDDAGTYQIKVVISDDSTSVQQQWTLVVANVNRAPMFGSTTPAQVEGIVGTQISLNLQATDPDSDPLTFSANTGNVNGAVWTWTPTVATTVTVTFTVTDARGASDSATITVTVVAADTTTTALIRLGTEVRGTTTYFTVTFPTGTGWDLATIKPRAVPVEGDWTWAGGIAPNISEGQKVLWNVANIEKCWFQILYGTTRGMDGNNVHPTDQQQYLTNCDPSKGSQSYCWSVHLPTCP